MHLDFNLIRNKQRIFIGGNDGANEILQIACHTLNHLRKPFDTLDNGWDKLTDAPLLLFAGLNELNPKTNLAHFHLLKPHVVVFHKIQEPFPADYHSFEDFINQYEVLADNLPKAGTLLYYQSDNVSMIIGKKERADIRNIEYAKIKNQINGDSIRFKFDTGEVTIHTDDKSFIGEVSAAFTLMKQLGVKEPEFIESLKTLNISV